MHLPRALPGVTALAALAALNAPALAGCSSNAPPADAAADALPLDAGNGTDATPDAPAADAPRDAASCGAAPVPMAFSAHAAARHPMDDALRMNHLQALATHNSYHLRPRTVIPEWDYEHAPLGTQLGTYGVRGVELDVHWSDTCQRFEVYHLGTLDDRTTCRVFTECLALIRDFSASHAGHQPIFVHIEPKDPDSFFDEARVQALDREVLSVFDRAWVITPDEVRGDAATLNAAVRTRGWPTLGAARGRVLFYIDNSTGMRSVYTHGGQSLDGRVMFVESAPDDPFAAVMILNDPLAQADAIRTALAANFLVRTRADSDPTVAQRNDRTQADAALASGAQLVSTDFPAAPAGSAYSVQIPGGTPSRCSSATAPTGCTPAAIEDPALLTR